MKASDAIQLLFEAALGAAVFLLAAMLIVALGTWGGFPMMWFWLFLIYILARLMTCEDV